MFCRNCGQETDVSNSFCAKCGAARSSGKKFCNNCGAATDPNAVICVKCGAALEIEGYDWLTALLLAIFLGTLGIHRFYTGHTGIGIGQIALTVFTCGIGGMVWQIIDIILIANGSFRDAQGRPLARKR
jgi:hypothetical protein